MLATSPSPHPLFVCEHRAKNILFFISVVNLIINASKTLIERKISSNKIISWKLLTLKRILFFIRTSCINVSLMRKGTKTQQNQWKYIYEMFKARKTFLHFFGKLTCIFT